MVKIPVCLLVAFVCVVASLPLETTDLNNDAAVQAPELQGAQVRDRSAQAHKMKRRHSRFISPLFSMGLPDTDSMVKMRTKRSYDECEKLHLCKLHARSGQSFFAAYELYFVNKENAHLWDHHARSMAECEQRYGDCYNK